MFCYPACASFSCWPSVSQPHEAQNHFFSLGVCAEHTTKMFAATTQSVQFLQTKPQSILPYMLKSIFPLRSAENAEIPTPYPQNAYASVAYKRHTHIHTHTKRPRKILFVNISHVKTNFKALLCAGRRVLWQHWPENWQDFASMPQITSELHEQLMGVGVRVGSAFMKRLREAVEQLKTQLKCHETPPPPTAYTLHLPTPHPPLLLSYECCLL